MTNLPAPSRTGKKIAMNDGNAWPNCTVAGRVTSALGRCGLFGCGRGLVALSRLHRAYLTALKAVHRAAASLSHAFAWLVAFGFSGELGFSTLHAARNQSAEFAKAHSAAAPHSASLARTQPNDRADHQRARFANAALSAAAKFWFVSAIIGQLLMVVYVIGFYGRAVVQGKLENWNKVLPVGYVVGDTIGNLILSLHLAFAVMITVGGALQLIPMVRARWPKFHRWNGRVYLTSAVVMSVGGLIMLWTRGTAGDLSQHIAISINALLIITCAAMALRYALARRFDLHRRWAMRLFLAVSGVWFFRVGLMFWIMVNQGPVGFDPVTFQGPFLTVLAFAVYAVLPLSVLQLYFHAQQSTGPSARLVMAAGLLVLTLVMIVGIIAAALFMWLPRL
jgi:hypothetical protein